jgi:hypothetical protein
LRDSLSLRNFLPERLVLGLGAIFCLLLRFRTAAASPVTHGAGSLETSAPARNANSRQKRFKLQKEDIKQIIPPMGACFASDHITVDGMSIHFMYREEPDFEVDSGWRFLSGRESQAYIDDPANLAIYDVNTIANYDPAIIPYLQYPVGTHLERVGETATFKIEAT